MYRPLLTKSETSYSALLTPNPLPQFLSLCCQPLSKLCGSTINNPFDILFSNARKSSQTHLELSRCRISVVFHPLRCGPDSSNKIAEDENLKEFSLLSATVKHGWIVASGTTREIKHWLLPCLSLERAPRSTPGTWWDSRCYVRAANPSAHKGKASVDGPVLLPITAQSAGQWWPGHWRQAGAAGFRSLTLAVAKASARCGCWTWSRAAAVGSQSWDGVWELWLRYWWDLVLCCEQTWSRKRRKEVLLRWLFK